MASEKSAGKTQPKRVIGVPFKPGNPGKAKGTKNKFTGTLREMILKALDGAGGVEYLQRQADLNPGPFLALVGKVLPTTLEATGDNVRVIVVTGVPETAPVIDAEPVQEIKQIEAPND